MTVTDFRDIFQNVYDSTAKAWRVQFIDSSGNVIKAVQIEENRPGSDCSGVDGATGRILTLQNTSTSGAPVSVWVDTQLIAQVNMTIVHNATHSTITFGGVNIYNTQSIRVLYYE